MNAILDDHTRVESILESQDAALARLIGRDFGGLVLRFVDQVLSSPRVGVPAVSEYFWRQYRLAEELEVVRQQRPAAYRALPFAPDDTGPVADLGQRR